MVVLVWKQTRRCPTSRRTKPTRSTHLGTYIFFFSLLFRSGFYDHPDAGRPKTTEDTTLPPEGVSSPAPNRVARSRRRAPRLGARTGRNRKEGPSTDHNVHSGQIFPHCDSTKKGARAVARRPFAANQRRAMPIRRLRRLHPHRRVMNRSMPKPAKQHSFQRKEKPDTKTKKNSPVRSEKTRKPEKVEAV